jgi:hypothetical protein
LGRLPGCERVSETGAIVTAMTRILLTARCDACSRRFDIAAAPIARVVDKYLCVECARPEQRREPPARFR